MTPEPTQVDRHHRPEHVVEAPAVADHHRPPDEGRKPAKLFRRGDMSGEITCCPTSSQRRRLRPNRAEGLDKRPTLGREVGCRQLIPDGCHRRTVSVSPVPNPTPTAI